MFSYTTHRVFFCSIFILTACFLHYPVAHAAPSFSCDNASALEKVICDDVALSQKDRQLADFYSTAYHHTFNNDVSGIVAAQRKWVIQRNKYCTDGNRPVARCLNSFYDERLWALAVNNLFSDHDKAQAEITRQHPQLTNVYQAIYDFVTIKNQQRRTQRVAQDISDAFDVLSGNQVILFNHVEDATVAARSANNLGTVLWEVSASHYGGYTGQLLIPCEAFIRQPDAIVWLEPRAGGAIDGYSPSSNCQDVMPELKHVNALQTRASQMTESADEGTNRFTYGAQARADYSALLTHSLAALHRYDRSDLGAENKNTAAFLKDNTAEVALALAELSQHYQKYFNTPAKAATAQAKHDLNLFLFLFLNAE